MISGATHFTPAGAACSFSIEFRGSPAHLGRDLDCDEAAYRFGHEMLLLEGNHGGKEATEGMTNVE